jgi:cyanophycin synthetase
MNKNLDLNIVKIHFMNGSGFGIVPKVGICYIEIFNYQTDNIIKKYNSFVEKNFYFENGLKDVYSSVLDNEAKEKNNITLLKSMFFWHEKIHELIKIPLNNKYYIEKINLNNRHIYKVLFSYTYSTTTIKILNKLQELYQQSLEQENCFDAINSDEIHKFLEPLRRFSSPGTNTRHFIKAAIEMNLPFRNIKQMMYIGYGKCMKKLQSTSTDNTSNIGVRLAKSKIDSSHLLLMNGLPVAPKIQIDTLQSALDVADKFGYPVVLKPLAEDQGRGVSSNIKTKKILTNIFKDTSKKFRDLILEKHIIGKDYRFTVVNGNVIKIMERIVGGIEGDGKSTIKELAEMIQQSSKNQRTLFKTGKNKLEFDNEAISILEENGYTLDTILKKNIYLPLRRQGNISTGGKEIIIPINDVHPDNISLAIEVARIFHLDFAGIDLISEDISTSWLENNTIVCEVNAVPQIGIKETPLLFHNILKNLMHKCIRIPMHLIVISKENIMNDKYFQNIMKQKNIICFSFNKYVVVNKRIMTNRAKNCFDAAQILLMHTHVNEAYCFMTPEDIINEGLPANYFDDIQIATSINQDILKLISPHAKTINYI